MFLRSICWSLVFNKKIKEIICRNNNPHVYISFEVNQLKKKKIKIWSIKIPFGMLKVMERMLFGFLTVTNVVVFSNLNKKKYFSILKAEIE